MVKKKNWAELKHEEKIQSLKDLSDEDIISTYAPPPEIAQSDFEGYLTAQREIWSPNVLGDAKRKGAPPNKEAIMGAWRDLNRSEALLELIDNSIDAWRRRKSKYGRYTAKTLQIYIDIDEGSNLLTYEDNAGGLREDQLENLVIPGFSDTDDTEATIGSYRTGGKKAIFKLAVEANIQTYYLDPDGIVNEAFGVHLDKDWLQDTNEYQFPYYPFKNKSVLKQGHTVYTLRLRDSQWDLNIIDQITTEIRRTYTLLMVRNPNIEIYFNDRETPLQPLDDFYVFSGASTTKVDIRPQKVLFKTTMPWKGVNHQVTIEVILGCRTTTGHKNNDTWGIDIYGNDRLFVNHNQNETIKWFELPTSNQKNLIRGLINIHGPNIFMPWDTHKRHLNVDREIVDVLKSKPIKELFSAWKEAYSVISGLPEIKETVKNRYEPWRDTKKKDLNIEFSDEVPFSSQKKRKPSLPPKVHKPKVAAAKPNASSKLVPVSIKLTQAEFRSLCSTHSVDTSNGEAQARKQLAEILKPIVLKSK
jgi:hypothetical protein